MFGKKEELNSAKDRVETIIGKNAEFQGKIISSGVLKIDGTMEGEIESESDIIISEGSKVKAQIKANNAVIAGEYQGNIFLKGKLYIKTSGKVTGDVKVEGIIVEEGAEFNGKCEMIRTENG
ncbi:bactofilin family protein [Thermovenabulum gondwanense]|uniref:Polymer-forming cytoskeletal n=1 Tax=Thermovenabulum gondwanense TaxID=520767 RepID=A0A162MSK1_9FIRM|nr:polymer-forming cytoskeletal protein [Thermovenabulum gondwanense]KYO67232.1 hypothetical protein ATZ99_05180 [Thermovenabulum gondwanense]